MTRKLVALLASLALLAAGSGCASFNQHRLGEIGELPSVTGKKPTLSLGISGEVDIGQGVQPPQPQMLTLWEQKIQEKVRASGMFSKLRPRGEESHISAEMSVLNYGDPNIGLAVLSGLTLTVIPVKASDNVRLTTVFMDSEGNELGTIVKEETMDTWIQILLIFATPFAWPGSVTDQVWGDLVNATLIDAHQQGMLGIPLN